jgi:predicted MFS family arabinose efflux permease
MMSGFHGLYSVGGIVGASAISGLLWLGLSPLAATLCAVGVILLLLAGFAKQLLPYGSESHDPLFVMPRGKVMFIGALCFIMFLAEGAMLDWSALFLTAHRGVEPAPAGLGYAAFAIAMSIGRLNGDRIVSALGGFRVLLGGGIGAAVGLGLAVTVPSILVTMLGFVLVGLGASNIVPVLFTAAGRQHSMPSNLAIAAITTIGYAGILCGPAGIGFVAKAASLPLALGLVGAGVLGVGLTAKMALRD